ncbi:MAG: type IV secretory system conjugative DNA transfer family protein, partial [Saprospiraceae bacterium]|nr:type IV secretory system conjugative DNA transfer family protein [Saprospiraceae bacterium]
MKKLVFSNRISLFFISSIPIATVAILISSNTLKVKGIITLLLGGVYTHSIISVSKNRLIHAQFIQNQLDSSILEQQRLKDQLVNTNKSNEDIEHSYNNRLDYQLGLIKGDYDEKIKKQQDDYTKLQHSYWNACKINKKYHDEKEELDGLITRYKDLNKQTDDFKLQLDNREIQLANKELEMKKHHLQYDVKIDQAKRDLESNFVRIQELETAYKQVFTIANNQEKLLSLAGVGQKVSFESYLLNNILDVFVQFEIQLQLTSINNKNNSIEYKFFLADITNLAKCNSKELLGALNNRISYQITITENKDNQLTILLSTVNQSRKVEPIKLERDNNVSIPPKYDNWILEIFKKSCHELIIGSTGSGKSTFIDNLINLADYNFGGNAEIFILDPKYPYTDWTNFTPQYRGLQAIDEIPGFKTCIDGLNDMLDVLNNRLKADTIAVNDGLPRNNFKPQIWVLDELLMVKDADSKLYQRAVETISRVGRGMGIRIMMLSQE